MKRKKQFVFGLLCLTMLLVFSGCSMPDLKNKSDLKIKVQEGEAIVTECSNSSALTEVVIPDEFEGVPVTQIANFGVVNLENVSKIVIGKNVREIGVWAFTNNTKLQAFEVDPENQWFCAVDGVLYTKDMKTLLFYPISRQVKTKEENGETIKFSEYDIPQGVEVIRSKAFYKCVWLSRVSIPDSVKQIEEKAFHRCGALEVLQFPEQLEQIGKDAFAYCTKLTSVVIPASVKQIDEYAFYNCKALLDVTVNNVEAQLQLGKKWYPTDNGRQLNGLNITWNG